jgi:hypothetical protein
MNEQDFEKLTRQVYEHFNDSYSEKGYQLFLEVSRHVRNDLYAKEHLYCPNGEFNNVWLKNVNIN